MERKSELVKEIFKIIKDTDIEEVSVSGEGFSVSILRESNPSQPISSNGKLAVVSPSSNPTTDEKATHSAPLPSPRPSSAIKKRIPIKSPMVGRFFNSSGPDKPPYVMKGNHIEYGQKVGVVEAMKIYKDVISSVKGVIVDVLVENNTPVEYGQEIYLVETEE